MARDQPTDVKMTDNADVSGKPGRSQTRWMLPVLGILVVAACVVFGRGWLRDDAALARALPGTWTAVDPTDAALHRREVPVLREQLLIRPDGTLTHAVTLKSEPESPTRDVWGWRVHKGRLYVRFLGEDAGGQTLPGFSFTVSDTTLSIRLKGRPPKEFVRR